MMIRIAKVYVYNELSGLLTETENGEYLFQYDKTYIENPNTKAVSLTLPKRKESYNSKTLFPFFDGLIPEGWLLEISIKNWKINSRDRMGLLLHLCKDCIGNVSIIEDVKI